GRDPDWPGGPRVHAAGLPAAVRRRRARAGAEDRAPLLRPGQVQAAVLPLRRRLRREGIRAADARGDAAAGSHSGTGARRRAGFHHAGRRLEPGGHHQRRRARLASHALLPLRGAGQPGRRPRDARPAERCRPPALAAAPAAAALAVPASVIDYLGKRSTLRASAALAPPSLGVPWPEIRLSKSSASRRSKSLRTKIEGTLRVFALRPPPSARRVYQPAAVPEREAPCPGPSGCGIQTEAGIGPGHQMST